MNLSIYFHALADDLETLNRKLPNRLAKMFRTEAARMRNSEPNNNPGWRLAIGLWRQGNAAVTAFAKAMSAFPDSTSPQLLENMRAIAVMVPAPRKAGKADLKARAAKAAKAAEDRRKAKLTTGLGDALRWGMWGV